MLKNSIDQSFVFLKCFIKHVRMYVKLKWHPRLHTNYSSESKQGMKSGEPRRGMRTKVLMPGWELDRNVDMEFL